MLTIQTTANVSAKLELLADFVRNVPNIFGISEKVVELDAKVSFLRQVLNKQKILTKNFFLEI